MSEIQDGQERLKRDAALHKKAARIWYNTLEELWPPEFSEEYFKKACDRCRDVYNENDGNLLLKKLMLMTYDYLGTIAKERKDDG